MNDEQVDEALWVFRNTVAIECSIRRFDVIS